MRPVALREGTRLWAAVMLRCWYCCYGYEGHCCGVIIVIGLWPLLVLLLLLLLYVIVVICVVLVTVVFIVVYYRS